MLEGVALVAQASPVAGTGAATDTVEIGVRRSVRSSVQVRPSFMSDWKDVGRTSETEI